MEILKQHPELDIKQVAEMYSLKTEELREAQVEFLRTKTRIVQLIHER